MILNNPIVSVVMGIYNEKNRNHVELAVDSILKQTFSAFELIICDDGSEIMFYQWLKAYCKKDPRIVLIRKEQNEGLAAALNTGINKAKGKYLARMDADDISKPRRFETQVKFLEKNQEYALVGCNAEYIDENGMWGIRTLVEQPHKRDFLNTSPFIHPAIMIRLDVIKKLRGYSTKHYALRAEDYELFMRLYAAGYCGYNLQENLFQYREDRKAYSKRKYCYRINEARVRYRGFQALGILRGNMRYVIKPLLVGMIPARIMMQYRKIMFEKEYKRG